MSDLAYGLVVMVSSAGTVARSQSRTARKSYSRYGVRCATDDIFRSPMTDWAVSYTRLVTSAPDSCKRLLCCALRRIRNSHKKNRRRTKYYFYVERLQKKEIDRFSYFTCELPLSIGHFCTISTNSSTSSERKNHLATN